MTVPPGHTPGPAIGDDKFVGYLLNPNHAEGGPKARYFLERGFTIADPKPFIQASMDHGSSGHLVRTTANEFGTRYVYEGPLTTPEGINPRVRSVWQHRNGEFFRLLVTAYTF